MVKAVFVLLFLTQAALARGADDAVKPVNTDAAGVALKGFDAVAYFTGGRSVKGSTAHEHHWSGAIWRFATAENRIRFAQNPEAYAPQFGGYCAWAVSRNYTADIDPEAFDIVNRRLYLNYSRLVQLRWKVQRDENIRKAEQNWPKLTLPAKGTK